MHTEESSFSRKKFIRDGLKFVGGAALLSSPLLSNGNPPRALQSYTVQEVMDLIIREVPNSPLKETVDTLKSGRPDQVVTGIVTTMFATVDLVRKVAESKANFIIAHEPTFYNHADNKNLIGDHGQVEKKLELLDKHGIAVWRFHDYCHRLNPDAISYGVTKKVGLLPYFKPGEQMMEIPSIKLGELVQQFKSRLELKKVRVIGDLSQECRRIALMPGAWGGKLQMTYAEEKHPDVLLVGELSEWETAEYFRDARALGAKTSLVILGHSVSEEPGMEWVAEWLAPKLPGLSVKHFASGDPFEWI